MQIVPALAVLLLLGPVSVAFSAIALQVLAYSMRARIGFRNALCFSAAGDVAEMLPLPAGLMVRGAALVRAGVPVRRSALAVLVAGVLWIGMASVTSACAFTGTNHGLSAILGFSGSVTVAACCTWFFAQGGGRATLLMLGIRVINLTLAVARLKLILLAIGIELPLEQAFLLVLAIILGSASSVAPGGLGISEMIAAAFALVISLDPAAAFVAVAGNRVSGLVASAAICAAMWPFGMRAILESFARSSTAHDSLLAKK